MTFQDALDRLKQVGTDNAGIRRASWQPRRTLFHREARVLQPEEAALYSPAVEAWVKAYPGTVKVNGGFTMMAGDGRLFPSWFSVEDSYADDWELVHASEFEELLSARVPEPVETEEGEANGSDS